MMIKYANYTYLRSEKGIAIAVTVKIIMFATGETIKNTSVVTIGCMVVMMEQCVH